MGNLHSTREVPLGDYLPERWRVVVPAGDRRSVYGPTVVGRVFVTVVDAP
jgi:hypothetical protein